MTRAALVVLGVLLLVPGARAASPEQIANDVSDEIMSPYCPGVTLHDCSSEAALDLRNRIESWAERGWTKARILDHLEDQWGDQIRATPPSDGWGFLAWLLPGLVLVAGVVLASFLAAGWRRGTGADTTEPAAVDPEDRSRLDRELTRLRAQR